ncbi:MAG: type II toxin-antitoxin system VapC family toxin [Azonexus sp.]|jgi:predicted nucleic-acid-binding protein|nr:type II toxin-antitoxin system VapC family toxin [Azonexus sp.]
MIVVADTNIIIRLFAKVDNAQQVEAAKKLIRNAKKLVVPVIVFCELVWVLQSEKSKKEIASDIRLLMNLQNLVIADDEVLAGLRMLDDGGDFADGVAQYTGSQLAGGASTFASFDQGAVSRLSARGIAAMIPQ